MTGPAGATVAVVPGEGAAPEAVDATLAVVDGLGLPLTWVHPPVGAGAVESHGSAFPDAARAEIDAADATLFGATSGASVGALFHLRWGRQTYANVRPTRFRPGFSSPLSHPDGIDLVIVRENLEDLYLFLEGDLADLAPLDLTSPTDGRRAHEMGPGRYAIKAITEAGSERVVRHGFELARRRKARGCPGRVVVAAKTNMLPQTDGLFARIGEQVAADYPDVEHETFIVDDFAHRLVARPHELDVVVLPNLYGDVLSDAAAALAGGLGLAPSGCYGDDAAYFESAHGTADDIAGQGIVNPTATMLSAVMLLEHLGFDDAARALDAAISAVYAEGRHLTPDQGGTSTTADLAAAVAAHVA
ncbi:isocitrate/isopropylmalate family dehydrogenase [Iamia majanohamensis]|uniref:Isocitrate/isopropylmalate family dehydrogenase n=1 Tax=Iamia majanohamensis TaxID=467976 RepID=A0AAE9Y5F2_9ACTN|nr:isocitrate/isopropylmalate family dehydrogenase [Iamia majanohamensis]WCO65746.1 isocitrate/isopropylmalate family dehydrogenase [Iamia majanohamensis]